VAQVAGDVERLAWLRRYAAAQSKAEDASEEWRLLEQEAGRHAERRHEEHAAQPSAQVGGDTVPVETEPPAETMSVPDPPLEPEPERRGGFRIGPLIWVAILVGWVVLQLLQGVGDGSSP